MKILLFGKSGQLGWELQRSLAPLGEVYALSHTEQGGDFTQLAEVAYTIRTLAPHIIVNAAAYTAVDRAESECALAHQINAEAPRVLAEEAARLNSWLVYYSTDYVFNGQGTKPWRENDAPAPLNVYGQSKLDGENATAHCPRHLIFRTSWVYAARGANFVRTMLRLAEERETLRVVNDQWGAPSGADLLADVSAHALRCVLKTPQLGGLYHLTANGVSNWHELAVFALHCAQACGLKLRLDPELIAAIPSSAYPTPATRPHNSRLDCAKLQHNFALHLPHWQNGVRRVVHELLNKP